MDKHYTPHTSAIELILSQVIPITAAAHKAAYGVSTVMFTSSIVDGTLISICINTLRYNATTQQEQ